MNEIITAKRASLKTKFLFGISLLLISFFIMILAGAPISAKSRPKRAALVQTAPIVEKTLSLELNFVGTSLPSRTSKVAAVVEGIVIRINFKPADYVKKGAVLVLLDQTSYEISLKSAQTTLSGAKLKLEEARLSHKRSANLKKAKTITVEKYEKSLFTVRTIEQEVSRAEAEVARLVNRIKRMTVRAPFSGHIVAQHTEVGQWLSPGSLTATLVDLSKIKVRIYLPERYLEDIKAGAPALVRFDAFNGETFKGKVAHILPLAEDKSRTLPVEISLPNAGGRIKPGLLARVSLKGTPRKALMIPKDALVLNRDKVKIFIVEDGKAKPINVTTGRSWENEIEIIGDVKPGQDVIIRGNENIRAGQSVRTVLEEPAKKRP